MPEQDEAMDRAAEQAATVRGEHAAVPERDEAMGADGEPISAADGTALVSASGDPVLAPSDRGAAQNAASAVYAHGHFL